MDIRNHIKAHLETVPFLLMVLNGVCILWFMYGSDTYLPCQDKIGHVFDCSLVTVVVLYALSKDWGFVAKRSLFCLFLLWAWNCVVYLFGSEIQAYFSTYSLIVFTAFIGITIYGICRR